MSRELRGLGDELPYTPPRAERIQEIRASLAHLPPVRRKRPIWPWIATAPIAAGIVAALVLAPAKTVERATIHAASGARFVYTEGKQEQVILSHGTVQVRVAQQPLVIKTMDAELKIESSLFDVGAVGDELQFVEVFEGVVELKREGELPIVLRAGSAWRRPEKIEAVEPQVVVEEPKPQPKPQPAPSPHEQNFRAAREAFAQGDFDRAASLFKKAETSNALAEDAAYGRALALERAGHRTEAITEMRRFLEQYADSARADEVAVSLGWLLIDESKDEARTLFDRAAKSPIARIRESATRGLEALAEPW